MGTSKSTGVMPVSIQGMLVEANSEMRDNELFNMEISAEMMKDYSDAVVGVVQLGLDAAQEAAKATKWAGMSSAIGTGISGGIGLVATGASVYNLPSTKDLNAKLENNQKLEGALNDSRDASIVIRAPINPATATAEETNINNRINAWKTGSDTDTFDLNNPIDDQAVELMSDPERDTVMSKLRENNKSLEMEREGRFSVSNNTTRLIETGSRAFGEIAQAGGKMGESENQAGAQKAQANSEVIRQIDQQLYSSQSDAQSKMNQFLNDANQVAAQIYVQVHA